MVMQTRVKAHSGSKNIITNIVFQDYETFNFDQANINFFFINYIQNKVVQLLIMQLPKETRFYVDIQ
jgi:hypothetical protein